MSLTASRPLPPAYPRELKTLGDHLRKKRLDLGLLQKDVSQSLGVNETYILWIFVRIILTVRSDHAVPRDSCKAFQTLFKDTSNIGV